MCLGREGRGQIKLQLSVNVQAVMSGVRCLDSLPFITKSRDWKRRWLTLLIWILECLDNIQIHDYSHTHSFSHVVPTDPWDTCLCDLTTNYYYYYDPVRPLLTNGLYAHFYKFIATSQIYIFLSSKFIILCNSFLFLQSLSEYWRPQKRLKETNQEKGLSFLQCCLLNHCCQNCNILWST